MWSVILKIMLRNDDNVTISFVLILIKRNALEASDGAISIIIFFAFMVMIFTTFKNLLVRFLFGSIKF